MELHRGATSASAAEHKPAAFSKAEVPRPAADETLGFGLGAEELRVPKVASRSYASAFSLKSHDLGPSPLKARRMPARGTPPAQR